MKRAIWLGHDTAEAEEVAQPLQMSSVGSRRSILADQGCGSLSNRDSRYEQTPPASVFVWVCGHQIASLTEEVGVGCEAASSGLPCRARFGGLG